MTTIEVNPTEYDNPPLVDFCDTSEQLNALARHVDTETTAFQSVLVSAIRILDLAYDAEHRIATAAISLAQKRKLDEMVGRIHVIRFMCRSLLNAQGARILQLHTEEPRHEEQSVSWWFYLTEGIETLERGIDWIGSIISGQPAGSPSRKLSDIIAALLRGHYDELLKEAEHWLTV